MVDFHDILAPAGVHLGVDAQSKKAALGEASELLADCHPQLDPRRLLEGLLRRERLGSTSIGAGVAIPHCRFDACPAPMAAFIRTRAAIDFDAPDGEGVDLMFVLAVPTREQRAHLEILGALARTFRDSGNRDALRRAATDGELFDALQRQLAIAQRDRGDGHV